MNRRMKLSKRLEAVCSMVPEGTAAVDVGCDHAYVPVRLVESGISPCAVASDIRPSPLHAAEEHILERGLSGKIRAAIADGVPLQLSGLLEEAGWHPEIPLTLITAGMGGLLMLDIISSAAERQRNGEIPPLKWYVASPQKDVPLFRRGLAEKGYQIVSETMVEEAGKYYPIILSELRGKDCAVLSDKEALLGPVLMRERPAAFLSWVRYRLRILRKVSAELPSAETERREQLLYEISVCETVVKEP